MNRQKNLIRDFSDAVPIAEILKHKFPKLVELQNHRSKNEFTHKFSNWENLNWKQISDLVSTGSNSIHNYADLSTLHATV